MQLLRLLKRATSTVIALLMAISIGAHAQDLPAATIKITSTSDGGSPHITTDNSGEPFSASFLNLSGNALGSTNPPFVSSNAYGAVFGGGHSGPPHSHEELTTTLSFFLNIVGPTNALVPVDLQYSLGAVSFFDSAFASISSPSLSLYASTTSATPVINDAMAHVFAVANTPYLIELTAFATGTFDGDISGWASATAAASYFEIDAIYLADNPGYQLEFSLGIGNPLTAPPAPVPEPFNYAMLLAGLGLLCFVRSRGMQKVVA